MLIPYKKVKRGCGYLQAGGLYLMSGKLGAPCDRLYFPIPVCPVCGETIRFSRGIQKINALKLFGEHKNCKDETKPCPVCQPQEEGTFLMWVGDKYYTPEEFVEEAKTLGVSKRINYVPKEFEVGKSWLVLAHQKAILSQDKEGPKQKPGIITAIRPTKLVKVLKENQATPDQVAELEEQGIDVMPIPDGDEDHITPYKPPKKQSDFGAFCESMSAETQPGPKKKQRPKKKPGETKKGKKAKKKK
jgi:hypothetical protein